MTEVSGCRIKTVCSNVPHREVGDYREHLWVGLLLEAPPYRNICNSNGIGDGDLRGLCHFGIRANVI